MNYHQQRKNDNTDIFNCFFFQFTFDEKRRAVSVIVKRADFFLYFCRAARENRDCVNVVHDFKRGPIAEIFFLIYDL